MKLEILFEPEPWQKGLRGDHVLWKKLCNMEIPDTNNILVEIIKIIESYTGDINADVEVYVNELDNGEGISSGYVSLEWWRETGLPLLESRIKELL